MIVALLLLVPIAVLSYLLWQANNRFDRAYQGWAEEREKLLQRIQVPERAVVEDFKPTGEMEYIPFEDDDAYWKHQEELSGNRD